VILPWPVRRLLIPVLIVVELVVLALLLPISVFGLLSLAVDRRARILRLCAMGASYLVLEWVALLTLLGVWLIRPLRGPAWWERVNVRLLARGLGAILGAARRTVGFRVELDEPAGDHPFSDPDPLLVLARHGGIGDSFSLVWLLAARYHRRPRIVLKGLLIWEPLIDVALTRMGACFLPAAARRGESLETRVAAIASSLENGESLLLFPEGGNWTPRRRLTAIGRLWAARKPEAARAAALMQHVLPPRAGGVLACLEARPDLAVVVVAHTGLDRVTTPGELWSALPFTTPMAVRWWPAALPPYGEDERVAWLTTEWAVVDQWIDSRRVAG
jgi:1-acyl-sn-glycerol-3-phosphate acyltransferase